MSNGELVIADDVRLAEYLAEAVCDAASGRSETECTQNYPRDVYFVGNLRPRPEGDADVQSPHTRELLNKLAPSAFGAEFLLRFEEEASTDIVVRLSWSCYYRIFPTFEQQRRHQYAEIEGEQQGRASLVSASTESVEEAFDDKEHEELETAAGLPQSDLAAPADRRRARSPQDSLYVRYRKVRCAAEGRVHIRLQGDQYLVDRSDLDEVLAAEMSRASDVARQDADCLRVHGDQQQRVRIAETELASPEAYERFCRNQPTTVAPTWGWETLAIARASGDRNYLFSLEMVNVSPMAIDAPNVEPFLFDTTTVRLTVLCLTPSA